MVLFPLIAVFGILLVVVIGCGSTDDPIEDGPIPSPRAPITLYSPVQNVDQILGTWLLKSFTIFNEDAVERLNVINWVSFWLMFKPEGVFQATHRYPIEFFADNELLTLKELQHIKKITVTFQGEYETVANQLRLNVMSSEVRPMQAAELDSDFESPSFLWVGETGNTAVAEIFLAGDGDKLLIVANDGTVRGKLIYQRN